MNDRGVPSIIVRLEVQKGAPLISFGFAADSSSEEQRPVVVVVRRTIAKLMPSNSKKRSTNRSTASSPAPTPTGTTATATMAPTPTPTARMSPPTMSPPAPNQWQCFGRRKYAEVVVETFAEATGAAAAPAPMATSTEQQPSSSSSEIQKLNYFCGHPFVEKTTGVLHFYKHTADDENMADISNCRMLCMIGVPSTITCRELLKFIEPYLHTISAMKIVRDTTPNQYMVVLSFKSHESAMQFYNECNETCFNQIEPERCLLVFVEQIESTSEESGGSLPLESLVELPTCAVCLERMDDSVLTILCNHTFHAKCMEQWADTTCPVCRHCQTPEITPDQKCFDCGRKTDLWICLICGNIGCGRYAEAHAYRHFEATSHTFTLQVGGDRVWDYAGDNYVHRLIQNAADGKVVEYQPNAEAQTDVVADEKMEAIQLEYTCLLTSQLEQQRIYFENRLAETERRFSKIEKMEQTQMAELEQKLKNTAMECEKLRGELTVSEHQRQLVERKHQAVQGKLTKVMNELCEERAINKMLRGDQNKWMEKVTGLEQKNEALHRKFTETVSELNEQVRDLMMHFDAQTKIQETVEAEGLTEKELQEGSVSIGEVGQHQAPGGGKSKRRTKK